MAVRRLAERLGREADDARLTHPGDFAGLDEAGHLAAPRLVDVVRRLDRAGPASAEIGCHPGRADDPERRRYRWGYSWPDELAALCDPQVSRAIAEAGWRLGSFADLAAAGSGRPR
jgi:predicted glycoside hydrolase/deacetylase ChbG (UPF0249 family)